MEVSFCLENLQTSVKHTKLSTSRSLCTIRGLTEKLKDLWILWRELWKKIGLHQLKESSNNFFKYTGLLLITKYQPHRGDVSTSDTVRLQQKQTKPWRTCIVPPKRYNSWDKVFFRIFKDIISFWEMGTIEKRVGNMIYISKGPQFTHIRHLNQLRKRQTDEVESEPP